jgi:hypothetical protein
MERNSSIITLDAYTLRANVTEEHEAPGESEHDLRTQNTTGQRVRMFAQGSTAGQELPREACCRDTEPTATVVQSPVHAHTPSHLTPKSEVALLSCVPFTLCSASYGSSSWILMPFPSPTSFFSSLCQFLYLSPSLTFSFLFSSSGLKPFS